MISGTNVDPDRLGVYIGSGIGGMTTFVNESKKLYEEGVTRISPLFIPMMISNMASGEVAIKYNAQGVCLPIVTACATGTHSIGEAFRAIKHGYADAMIAGGTEAAVHPLAIGGFNNSKALSRATDPKRASLHSMLTEGFVMGRSRCRFWRLYRAVAREPDIVKCAVTETVVMLITILLQDLTAALQQEPFHWL